MVQPVISSFSPVLGPAGTHVVISGTGFSTNINDNIVSFGSIRASVLSAGNNQLTVVVPVAASYQPISIAVNNLIGYSAKPFNVTYSASINFTDSTFDPRINIPITNFHLGFVTADMDGDGKIDVITTGDMSFSVMRNIGTAGSVSFSPQVNFPVDKTLRAVFTNDINGDGKQDVVIFTNDQAGFVVYTNQSTPGNLVFTQATFVATGGYPTSLAAADFDADGKTDMAISFLNSTSIGLVRNLSTASTINFSMPVYLSMGIMIAKDLTSNDFNNDGKPDIAIASSGTNTDSLFVLTNNSSPGTISFQPRVKFADASKATAIASGDLDGDGRTDVAVVNYGKVSVFRNIGTGAVVDFDTAVNSDGWYSVQKIVLGDLNGDGKPEMVTAEQVLGFASLFANKSVPGNISFAPKIDYTVGYSANYLSIDDLDADGKTDLLAGDIFDNSFYCFRSGQSKISNGRLGTCTNFPPIIIDATNNTSWVSLIDDEGNLIAAINANGNNLGMINYGLFVRNGSPREDASGRLYLNRNVTINPAVQPATPVDLRIYITSQEFEALRTALNSQGLGSGVDTISNLAFYKNETHLCEDTVEAATSVVSVIAKPFANGYVLSASIPSFSAFYMASVAQSSLPVSLLSFSGRQVSGKVMLNWVAAQERNAYFFSIEKSNDGSHFESIGRLPARNSSGENSYSFIDTSSFSGAVVYYRLRQVDLDGKFVYSHIISIRGVNTTKGLVTVFPNPVSDIIQLQLNLPLRQQLEWTITDNVGRTVQHGNITAPAGVLTMPIVSHGLSRGVYYLVLKGGNFEQKVKLVKVD